MENTPNRLYKSHLFVMIFEDKEKLLELYNAVSGNDYRDPELLEINTLENAIYMSMKNDISFLIDAGCLYMSISPPTVPTFRCGFCSICRIFTAG